eukprot:jgi/Galph1/428/GphlegSOOS_G5220.1
MLFNSSKKRNEVVRQQRRTISRAQRETDRERERLEREAKNTEAEIKKLLKQLCTKGQKDAAKTLAKALVHNRNQQQKLYQQRAQLGGISHSIVIAKQTGDMAKTFGNVSEVLAQFNESTKVNDFVKTMKEYEKQNTGLATKQELMSDAADSAFEDNDIEGESEEVLQAVLDEVGLSYLSQMEATPKGQVSKGNKNVQLSGTNPSQTREDVDGDLVDRLTSLKAP